MTASMIHPPSEIGTDNKKYQPAYDGARFDQSGYCLKHPMIRLCKPASNASSQSLLNPESEMKPQAKFVIVRKTCPMCGEHSLRNDRVFKKQNWSHGYQPPTLIERPSQRGVMSAESGGKRNSSSSTLRRSSTASTASASRSPPSLRKGSVKDLESLLDKKKIIPPPPLRDSSKQTPLQTLKVSRATERDVSVESSRPSKPRDVSADSRGTKSRDTSAPRKRLSGKVPYGHPDRRERSVSRSSRREDHNTSASSLLDKKLNSSKLEKKLSSSRGRSSDKSRTKSRDRSSSRHSRASTATTVKAPLTRRHSAEYAGSKSVCNASFQRKSSAPSALSGTRSITYTRQGSQDESSTSSVLRSSTRSTNKYTRQISQDDNSSKPTKQRPTSVSTASLTSSDEELEMNTSRGRSLFTSKPRGRSRSKSSKDTSCERSFFQRGRSSSKSSSRTTTTTTTKDKSIFSAQRSFTLRPRSLSRNASRVLKTTSSMDGSKDAEPCTQRYEVPFNPSTGACNYHPECMLAVRNGGRGGWRIVCEGCPKCLE